jgi:hypothetical protein
MADEQIKIRIQADAEQFKAVSAAVEKALADIGKQAEITQGKIKGAGDAVKKSNQQWTNLALIIQDLPFGFRGIQNNLPALVGSIAGATGAIYLAFSAVVAITTAYEKEIVQLIYGITELDRATQSMNKAVSTNVGDAKAEIAVNQSLLIIINDLTKSTSERTRALNQLKSNYEGNLELQKTDITDGAKLIEIINKISAALIRKAKAQAFAKLIAEEEAKLLKLQSQSQKESIKNLGFIEKASAAVIGATIGLGAERTIGIAALSNQEEQIKSSTSTIKLFTDALNANTLAQIQNNDAATLDDTKPKTGKTDAQKKAEKDAKAQKKIQDFIAKQAARFGQLEAAPNELNPREQEEEYYKQLQEDYKNKVAFNKKTSENTIANLNNQYKAELALTGNDYKAKLELQNAYLEQLKQGYMEGTIGLTEFNAERTALIIEQNKTITDAAKQNMQDIVAIGTSIMSAMGPALDALLEKGASLGEVLTQALTDILKKLVKVAIAAALTVLLLSALGVVNFAEFGKNFVTLFKSGMGFGSLDFAGAKSTAEVANNTAQGVSNNLSPAIASNSSGGKFTLRGQDLLLSMNRSEKSLNLRRG